MVLRNRETVGEDVFSMQIKKFCYSSCASKYRLFLSINCKSINRNIIFYVPITDPHHKNLEIEPLPYFHDELSSTRQLLVEY